MSDKYQAWIVGRDPVTLQEVFALLIFAHADRLRVEGVIENAAQDFAALVDKIKRHTHPHAIVRTELRLQAVNGELPC